MNKRIPPIVAVVVIGSILVSFACWVYFGDTIFRQRRHMQVAREFLPGITNAVFARPEFRDVIVGVGTAKGGCFVVAGLVETRKQATDLEIIIFATKPPFPVVYHVKVLGEGDEYNGP